MYRKLEKMHKNVKNWKYSPFLGLFLGHSGVFGVNQKGSKGTYRMIRILRQINSMDRAFQLGYEFGAWQILLEKSY